MAHRLLVWLLLGLPLGLLLWPYQALSELGFALQRSLWLAAQPRPLAGGLLLAARRRCRPWIAPRPTSAAHGRSGGCSS